MNTFDIIVLIVLAWGAYRGFKKGLVMEIVAILALVLGLVGAFKLLHLGMDWLDQYFEISGHLLPYVAFILLFVGIIILVNLLGKTVKKVLDMTLLGGFDRFVGALIGAFKWAFGLSLLLWLTLSFNISLSESVLSTSITYPFIEPLAPNVVSFIGGLLPFTGDLIESIENLLKGT